MAVRRAQAAAFLAHAAWSRRPRPRGLSPCVDARLRAAYIPRLHRPAPQASAPDRGRFHGVSWTPDPGPAAGGGAGLVGCSEFGQRDVPQLPRGSKGMTPYARQQIDRACAVLEEDRALMAFWTVTLPDAWLERLRRNGRWPDFQNGLRHRLHRALGEAGLRPQVLLVVELHPKRSIASKQAIPHVHIVFRGRHHSRGSWALSPSELDGLILQAANAAGIRARSCPAAGQVEPIRRSIRHYLSNYLSKATRQASATTVQAFQGDIALCPRQWFSMTRSLLHLVRLCRFDAPAEWLEWLIDRRTAPEKGAPWVIQMYQPPAPRAPGVWVIRWRSTDTLLRSWEAYEAAVCMGPAAAVRYGATAIR